jgi:hypothetical protein
MGASLTMIDRDYGHHARDGREHAIRRNRRQRFEEVSMRIVVALDVHQNRQRRL